MLKRHFLLVLEVFDPKVVYKDHMIKAIGDFHKTIPSDHRDKRDFADHHKDPSIRHIPDSGNVRDLLLHHYVDDEGKFRNDIKSRPKTKDLAIRLQARE